METAQDAFIGMLITDTELPKRVQHMLNRNGIYTVGGLILRSEEELKVLTNIGTKTVSSLKSLLWERGLVLRRHDEATLDKARELYASMDETPAYVLIANLNIHRMTAWRLQRIYCEETVGEIARVGKSELQASIMKSNGNDNGRAMKMAMVSAVGFFAMLGIEFAK